MARNNGRKIALGALLAGVAGYLTGILTAPKSGKETREELANRAEDIKDDTVDKLQDLQDQLADLIDRAKDKSVELRANAREEFNEAVASAKDAKNKTGTLLKSVKAGEADDPELNKAIRQAKSAIKNLSKFYKS